MLNKFKQKLQALQLDIKNEPRILHLIIESKSWKIPYTSILFNLPFYWQFIRKNYFWNDFFFHVCFIIFLHINAIDAILVATLALFSETEFYIPINLIYTRNNRLGQSLVAEISSFVLLIFFALCLICYRYVIKLK